MGQISKSELLNILQIDASVQYIGAIQINSETRLYYRIRIGAAQEPCCFKIVYIVG